MFAAGLRYSEIASQTPINVFLEHKPQSCVSFVLSCSFPARRLFATTEPGQGTVRRDVKTTFFLEKKRKQTKSTKKQRVRFFFKIVMEDQYCRYLKLIKGAYTGQSSVSSFKIKKKH